MLAVGVVVYHIVYCVARSALSMVFLCAMLVGGCFHLDRNGSCGGAGTTNCARYNGKLKSKHTRANNQCEQAAARQLYAAAE